MKLVKEEFEVTDHNKLSHPAFFDSSGFGDLHVAFVSCTNTSGGINTQRPFGCKKKGKSLLDTSGPNQIFRAKLTLRHFQIGQWKINIIELTSFKVA